MAVEKVPDEIAKALVDPACYAEDTPLQTAFTWLRAHRPVAPIEVEGFDPFWAITRYADIVEIGKNPKKFHNGDRQTTLTDQANDGRIREMTGGSPHLIRSLVQMDPPDHPIYRALTMDWFTPGNVRKLEGRIREIARAAVARMRAMDGRCDFVRDVALGYPLHVIMEILGVPEEDEGRMLMLTQELFGVHDDDLKRGDDAGSSMEYAQQIQAVVADFDSYFSAISAGRRANPRDDLATVIANAQINGEPMGGFESLCYYMLVATAGHDTTSSSTAGAIWELAKDPAEFAKVRANPGLIPSLVDEAIRWITPVKHFMRSATIDTEIRGQAIAAGDWMMLCFLSGNRDEDVFDDPFRFRVDRQPNRHMAFGYGAHVCLGQHLAKLEMRIFFEELLPHLTHVELDGEPTRSKASFVNGPKSVPIRFRFQ
nr:cytochrome P450 [Sphingomonas sp. Y57]